MESNNVNDGEREFYACMREEKPLTPAAAAWKRAKDERDKAADYAFEDWIRGR